MNFTKESLKYAHWITYIDYFIMNIKMLNSLLYFCFNLFSITKPTLNTLNKKLHFKMHVNYFQKYSTYPILKITISIILYRVKL